MTSKYIVVDTTTPGPYYEEPEQDTLMEAIKLKDRLMSAYIQNTQRLEKLASVNDRFVIYMSIDE